MGIKYEHVFEAHKGVIFLLCKVKLRRKMASRHLVRKEQNLKNSVTPLIVAQSRPESQSAAPDLSTGKLGS